MDKGDTVVIYRDPVKKKDSEGRATLKHFQGNEQCQGVTVARWLVKFDDDVRHYSRRVSFS